MQTVIDNILINYEVFGLKNTNPILILHGWKRNLKDWKSIATDLSKKNKVVLVDLPGFGASSLPKKKIFDTYDYAGLIGNFIDKLNLKNTILIGHSFGGKISIVITSQNNLIKKSILVDPSGITNKTLITSLKIGLFKILKPLIKILPKPIRNNLINLFTSEDYKNAGDLKESFKKIVVQDVSSDAKKITVPTMIIWGENDKEVPISSAKKLKSLIKNSSIRIVWKAGHHPHLEKPEKFLEIVEEFI